MSHRNITVTDDAHTHLTEMLETHPEPNTGIRLFIENAGTPNAECCLAYCSRGQREPNDHTLHIKGLTLYIDPVSHPYLDGIVIGYEAGQLSLRSPQSKSPNAGGDPTLETFMSQYRQGEFKR